MSNKKVKNSTCFSIHYYATTALSIMARRVVPAISYNIKIFGFQALYDIISTFCINIINCWEQILFLSILECSLRNYLNISYIQHSLETALCHSRSIIPTDRAMFPSAIPFLNDWDAHFDVCSSHLKCTLINDPPDTVFRIASMHPQAKHFLVKTLNELF